MLENYYKIKHILLEDNEKEACDKSENRFVSKDWDTRNENFIWRSDSRHYTRGNF